MISQPPDSSLVIGRFAPSPTGRLHFGSLVTAVASYCHAKSRQNNGVVQCKWLVRIEDTDTQRCKPEHSDHILKTLNRFGLHWDDSVLYQSKRLEHYQHALEKLMSNHHAYACECSRKTLSAYASTTGQTNTIYPGFCRHKALATTGHNIRLAVPDDDITFDDSIQGHQCINPQQHLGDMVLKRRDGIINYILSSAIDDAIQGVTQVIRGLDLLALTPVQVLLTDWLKLPPIKEYGHLPLALNANGQKLSKQTKAKTISTDHVTDTLSRILASLHQPAVEVDSPERMLAQAVSQWDISRLSHQQALQGDYE